MRVHLNERSSSELLKIMQHYGNTSTNHQLNLMISGLYKALFENKNPSSFEVDTNEQRSNSGH